MQNFPLHPSVRPSIALLLLTLTACSKPVEVTTATARKETVEQTVTTLSTGIIEAQEEAMLSFGSAGRISKVSTKIGDRVAAGTTLVELENSDMRATFENAKREYQRSVSLHKDKVISDSALENAARSFEVSKGNYERTLITAPFKGIVTELNAKVGELAGAVTTSTPKAVVRLVNDETMLVRGEVDEVDVPRLKIGQKVRLKVQTLGGKFLPGEVLEIYPQVNTQQDLNRSVTVRIKFLDKTELRTGGSADVEIVVDTREQVLSIPSRTILSEGPKRYVFTLEDSKAHKKFIDVGLTNYSKTEIRSGLEENTKVIFPPEKVMLQDGMKVMPQAPEPKIETAPKPATKEDPAVSARS